MSIRYRRVLQLRSRGGEEEEQKGINSKHRQVPKQIGIMPSLALFGAKV
jgi:hypothetical protein